MRIIGVLDLSGGQAVHAVAGARAHYRPVRAAGGRAIALGDPVALASAYRDRLGVTEIYCADLDAIQGGAVQETTIRGIAALGLPLWLDAGVASVARAERALALGATQVIVGLETLPVEPPAVAPEPSLLTRTPSVEPLASRTEAPRSQPSFTVLRGICQAAGRGHAAFSLDLRHGKPVTAASDAALDAPVESLAAGAARAGAGAVIVLDLARVGTGAGLDVETIRRVRHAVPAVTLLAGGGVRGADDLERLADAGCDGALVATALQDGRLSAADVAALHARSPRLLHGSQTGRHSPARVSS
jgi:uncharacterized protein related to proFAR isomerase